MVFHAQTKYYGKRRASKGFILITIAFLLTITSLITLAPASARAQWSSDPAVNTPVCTTPYMQMDSRIVYDGLGGYYVVWTDGRSYEGVEDRAFTSYDIYAQHFNSLGVAQWTENGIAVCTAADEQGVAVAVADGEGGLIVAWSPIANIRKDASGRGDAYPFKAQKLAADGSKQWAEGGVLAIVASENSALGWAVSDGDGGVIMATMDGELNRIKADGTLAWGTAENPIKFDVEDPVRLFAPDGQGGAVVAWEYEPVDLDAPKYIASTIVVQRINAQGQAAWNGGEPVLVDGTGRGDSPLVLPDGTGGYLVGWSRFPEDVGDARSRSADIITVQRLDADGNALWDEPTEMVTVAMARYSADFANDGAGGGYITYGNDDGGEMYVQKVDADGSLPWDEPVCLTEDGDSLERMPNIFPRFTIEDGSGGVITAWTETNDVEDDALLPKTAVLYRTMAQRIDAEGEVLWAEGGATLSTKFSAEPHLASNGQGGAVAVFVTTEELLYADEIAPRVMQDTNIHMQGINAAGELGDPGYDPLFNIHSPYKPVLDDPDDNASGVSLTPTLETEDFSDPDEGDTHGGTRWQISLDAAFTNVKMDITSASKLTSLVVPTATLLPNTTYYWRVRFFDAAGNASYWSDPFSFTTGAAPVDANANGIADEQEVDDDVDLDGDGTPDNSQAGMGAVNTAVGEGQIAVLIGDNVTSIDEMAAIDPATIDDTDNRPDELPFGVISFRLQVANPGDTARVTIYLSEAAPEGYGWYKYDSINGWQDYSAHATFSEDRKSVTLELKDGGYGDADGVANGIIVDPSGPAFVQSDSTGGTGNSFAGCFISSLLD